MLNMSRTKCRHYNLRNKNLREKKSEEKNYNVQIFN